MTPDPYSHLYEHQTRTADLQDIAAMDRLAAELAPPSALRRWARQRRTAQRPTSQRPTSQGRRRAA
jgi:hypothetical protein